MNEFKIPPVLLIVYNRPDLATRVFYSIRDVKPSFLMISADGPKVSATINDLDKIELCRGLAKLVDWDCTLILDYSDINLGARNNVIRAINNFFKHVDHGIILEDDVLPNKSFFKFCSYSLNKYKNDTLIYHINGCNFQDGRIIGDGSYYFSQLSHGWGWATWKRAWEKYDPNLTTLDRIIETNQLIDVCWDKYSANYFSKAFKLTRNGKIVAWDYQWLYHIWSHGGLCLTPNCNLVSLIGFTNESTNCKDSSHPSANLATVDLDSFVSPTFRISSKTADSYEFYKYTLLSIPRRIVARFKWELMKIQDKFS